MKNEKHIENICLRKRCQKKREVFGLLIVFSFDVTGKMVLFTTTVNISKLYQTKANQIEKKVFSLLYVTFTFWVVRFFFSLATHQVYFPCKHMVFYCRNTFCYTFTTCFLRQQHQQFVNLL